ncbi:MAG: hypothetical protein ABI297_05265 [Ginsengibacter sp.]
MNRKYIMIASAIVMGLSGLAASFLPVKILMNAGISSNETLILFVQVTGALYLGFAMMNWMAKTVLIGGIYARPLAMGNFTHFVIAAITLLKVATNHSVSPYLWVATIIYSIFASLFGIILFTSPVKKTNN